MSVVLLVSPRGCWLRGRWFTAMWGVLTWFRSLTWAEARALPSKAGGIWQSIDARWRWSGLSSSSCTNWWMENHLLVKMLPHEMLPAHPRPGNHRVEWIICTVPTLPDRWKLEKHHHPCHESLVLWSQAAGEGRGDEMVDSGDSLSSGFGFELVWPRLVVRLLDKGWNAELFKSGWDLRPRIFSGFWEPGSALIFRSNQCHRAAGCQTWRQASQEGFRCPLNPRNARARFSSMRF